MLSKSGKLGREKPPQGRVRSEQGPQDNSLRTKPETQTIPSETKMNTLKELDREIFANNKVKPQGNRGLNANRN